MESDFINGAQPSEVSVHIAEEVAALLGAELARQCRTDPQFLIGWCYECGKPFDARISPIAIIAEKAGEYLVVCGVHANCSPSHVAEPALVDAFDRTGLVRSNISFSFMPYGDSHRSVIFVEPGYYMAKVTDHGEFSDAMSSHLLARGWAIASDLDSDPVVLGIDQFVGWRRDKNTDALGLPMYVQMLQQVGSDLTPHEIGFSTEVSEETFLWAQQAKTSGWVDMYVGPFGIQSWGERGRDDGMLRSAFSSGRTVSARVEFRKFDELIDYSSNT